MAERADSLKILEEIRKDPIVDKFLEIFFKKMREYGGSPDGIFVTEDMTDQEVEMQCIEKSLLKGLSYQEAEKEAREFMDKVKIANFMLDSKLDSKNNNNSFH